MESHRSVSNRLFWALAGCNVPVGGNRRPQVLAATAQLAYLHWLFHLDVSHWWHCHHCPNALGYGVPQGAGADISLLLAQILGSSGANRNGEKQAAAMPILCLSVEKSCNFQGHQNSGPSTILLDCIESSNMEIVTN